MSLGDRLGLAGIILTFFATAAPYLWPDKKWVGWLSLASAGLVLLLWGWLEFGHGLPRFRSQYPVLSTLVVFITGGCLAVALFRLVPVPTKPLKSDAAKQPDMALAWDWPEDVRKHNSLLGRTEKDIIVHNRSDEYVYNIRIQPICLSSKLMFDEIHELAPKQQYSVIARWNGRSSKATNYIYYFSGNEEEARKRGMVSERKGRLDNFFFKIPITFTYETGSTVWESVFEFHYDPGEDSSFVKKSEKRIS